MGPIRKTFFMTVACATCGFFGYPNEIIHLPFLLLFPFALMGATTREKRTSLSFFIIFFFSMTAFEAVNSTFVFNILSVVKGASLAWKAATAGAIVALWGGVSALAATFAALAARRSATSGAAVMFALWWGKDLMFAEALSFPCFSFSAAALPWPFLVRIAEIVGADGCGAVMAACAFLSGAASSDGEKKAAVVLAACLVLFGVSRIPEPDGSPRLRLAAVTANVPTSGLSSPGAVALERLRLDKEMTGRLPPADLVVWAESVVSNRVLLDIADPAVPMPVMAGCLFKNAASDRPRNRVVELASGTVVHEKRMLAPFGEYDPFAPAAGPDDLEPGNGPLVPVKIKGAALGFAICYEGMDAGLAVSWMKAGADHLVVISNDSWLGDIKALDQAFLLAGMRAVETGMPMVRVSNMGITGMALPDGTLSGIRRPTRPQSVILEPWKTGKKTVFRRLFPVRWAFLVCLSLLIGLAPCRLSARNP